MYPLSVISLASIDGASVSSSTFVIRSDEAGCAAFHCAIVRRTCSRTIRCAASSANVLGAPLPGEVGGGEGRRGGGGGGRRGRVSPGGGRGGQNAGHAPGRPRGGGGLV